MITLTDLSDATWRELGNPSSVSIPAISYWFRTNTGRLNSAIFTGYSVLNNEFSPTMGDTEGVIFRSLFMIHFYDLQVNANLGAAGISTTLSVDSDGSEVKLINKNDLAKTYLAAKKDFTLLYNQMVSNYLSSLSGPIQVSGDDYIPSYYGVVSRYSRYGRNYYY